MSGMDEKVRARTDALDSLGNTTAATGKGFAIGSAMLTALALLSSFIAQVRLLDPDFAFDLAVDNPAVLIGVFIGGMLPFLFSALTMSAVGKSAPHVMLEVRRQFAQDKGILLGTSEPDYARCVTICTKSAQKQMILPAVIAVISPIAAGIFLGVNGVTGLLLGSSVTGFLLAVFMSNSGGAWDNAKNMWRTAISAAKAAPRTRRPSSATRWRSLQGYLRPLDQYPDQTDLCGRHRLCAGHSGCRLLIDIRIVIFSSA